MKPTLPAERAGAVVLAAFAFLVLVAFSNRLTSEAITPRSALLLLALPALPWSLHRAWSIQPVATACASGFAVIAAASAALSQSWLSVFGQYNWNTGLLFVAALVTCWSLGVASNSSARRALPFALSAGFLANAGVALVQMQTNLSALGLGRFEGRAPGLFGNPVHLAAIAAGAFALSGWNTMHARAVWAGVAALAVVVVQVSGSRLALLVVIVAAVALTARYRSVRCLLLLAALGIGLVAGEAVSADTGGPTGVARAVATGTDPHARVEVWKTALDALIDHPIAGAGPGRFQAGVAPYRTLELARTSPDGSYIDAHNMAFEYAVTTGGLGVLLLAGWVVATLLRARPGPLLWFSIGVLALHLAQPQHVGTTPLAFLALGAASRRGSSGTPVPGRWYVLACCLLVPPALYGAGRLLAGDARLASATTARSPEAAVRADALLPPWPQPARRVAQLHIDRAKRLERASDERAADVWLETAARRDPSRAFWWTILAEHHADVGNDRESRTHYLRALEADPFSVRALTGLAKIERQAGNTEAAIELEQRREQVSG